MRHALRLAAAGVGSTYPNPCVGAVVARRGRAVGAGRSRATGKAHAEVVALKKAGGAAKGATLYVTLEPCRHHGRTPPCTRAIVEAGIERVVVGARDPAVHARGRGLADLRRAGVEVVEGVLGARAAQVHAHYLHHTETGRPWVTLKAAVSLDGQVAVASGDSKWITGELARKDAHRLRARHHAIGVGSGTVASDDPALTVRHVRGSDPDPILFDSRLRLARHLGRRRVLRPGTLVLHTAAASARNRRAFEAAGLELVLVKAAADGRVSIPGALRALGQREVRSLMIEGGGELLASFVRHGAWERLHLYQAPRLMGQGKPLLSGLQLDRVSQAPVVRILSRRRLGEDWLIVGAPKP